MTNDSWLSMTRLKTGDWDHARRVVRLLASLAALGNAFYFSQPFVPGRQKLVLANGCYDMLHPGHVENLYEAACLGDFLIVSIDADEDVLHLKGRRPILPSSARAFLVACLPFVQAVTWHTRETAVGEDHSLPALIRFLEPDIWAARDRWGAGDDNLPEEEVKAARDVGAQIVQLPRHGYWSSSGLIAGSARPAP